MKRFFQVIAAAALGAAIGRWVRRRAHGGVGESDRSAQSDPRGEPVVEVWGDDSFPASDPPQSW